MPQENIIIIFKIESEKVFNVTERHTHVGGHPLPNIGDAVFLQPSVEHSGDFVVTSRKFNYTPQGRLEAVEITVK